MYHKISFLLLTALLLNSQITFATDFPGEKLEDGYYGTWGYATPGSSTGNAGGGYPLVAHCGFKITWTDRANGTFIAETVRNQTNGGGCEYVMLKYQCSGTTCLSRNANPIDLLPDGTFVFYSYKYNLPMKYSYYGTEDQSHNLFMGFGSVGIWNGTSCSTLTRCPEAHNMALAKATEDCHAAGYSQCKEIWSQQVDWYTMGPGAHYFSTVQGF